MSSPPAHPDAGDPASQPAFPDEILEEIFLRLDAAEDLARASAACTAFHRVVSARRFLRRLKCLHPALALIDSAGCGAFHPAEPPHRSAPDARALARAADLTFSFLGTPHRWQVCDSRDGRVLLYWQAKIHLMVCDPLHRCHVQLPLIPKDLAFSASRCFLHEFDSFSASRCFLHEFDSFLDPATDTEKEKQDLSFRVICAVKNQHNLMTFLFSSATGKWRGIMFDIPIPVPLRPYFSFQTFRRYYAHGCFFWRTGDSSSFMVMLNMHDMKLSLVDLPPGTHENPQRAIVEAGEGTIGLFTISEDMLQLYCKSLQGTDWHHERKISLPKLGSYWKIHNAAAGYLLLQAMPFGSFLSAKQESQYFTLNLKTFLVERLCIPNQYIAAAHLYASFLLPFSQPSI